MPKITTSLSPLPPIGVFDSGVGGLTVLKELALAFPGQSWVYLGDTARLPYGPKSSSTIRSYTEENLFFLNQFNCQAFIIACNSASAQFPEDQFKGLPVFKVIKPGAAQALKETKINKIGIIGTKATINSKVYENELYSLGFTGELASIACPLFVPLVEEELFDHPATDLIIDRYLNSLKLIPVDTLILGCTHYRLLVPALDKYFNSSIKLVSSEKELILALIQSRCIETRNTTLGKITLYTTDKVEFVAPLAKTILHGISHTIEFKNLNS